MSNALITVRRDGGTSDFNIGNVYVQASTSDGSGVSGTDYIGVTNTLTFPVGEVLETFTVPIINSPVVESNRTVNLTLSNPTDAALGAQPTAILTIVNVNSDVTLSTPNYFVVKNVTSGEAIITIMRNNSIPWVLPRLMWQPRPTAQPFQVWTMCRSVTPCFLPMARSRRTLQFKYSPIVWEVIEQSISRFLIRSNTIVGYSRASPS